MDYETYIRSRAWQVVRRAIILRCKGICERCKRWPVANVHHLTYERLGCELMSDLLGVCSLCHRELHNGDETDAG